MAAEAEVWGLRQDGDTIRWADCVFRKVRLQVAGTLQPGLPSELLIINELLMVPLFWVYMFVPSKAVR